MSPFFTVTIRDGAEKYGDAAEKTIESQWRRQNILLAVSLTIDFQLNHFSDAGANAIVSLTQIESFAIFFHMLQQQRSICQQFGERFLVNLFIIARFTSYNGNVGKLYVQLYVMPSPGNRCGCLVNMYHYLWLFSKRLPASAHLVPDSAMLHVYFVRHSHRPVRQSNVAALFVNRFRIYFHM